MKEPRLLPLVMIAAGAMLVLRVLTMMLGAPPELGVTQAHAQDAAPAAEAEQPAAAEAEGGEKIEIDPTIVGATRRAALEQRASDLDLREQLLAATQARVEERIAELEAIEQRIDAMLAKRDAEEDARFAGLVEMYAKMKPKDAARILNGLDLGVLQRVAERIKPSQMSEIMAEMDASVAQKLTMELSAQPQELTVEATEMGELPKIVGVKPQE